MSARAPRKSFANPFVLTLAAIPAACAVQSGPSSTRATNPSQPEHQHVHSDMQDHPPPGHEQPQPPPSEQPTQPSMTPVANPPRPDVAQAEPSTEPPPPRGYREWSVSRESGKCSSMVKVHCPEGAMCNPPPPAKYTCPKFMADGDRIDVIQKVEKGECVVDTGDFQCPPNAKCNPPKPQKVTCPK